MKWSHNILERLILPAGDVLLNTTFVQALKEFRRTSEFSEEQLTELQIRKLNAVMQHAASLPFYHDHLQQRDHLNQPLTLEMFPVMTKKIIKDNIDRLLWHPDKKAKLICEKSSGSSGVQGEVYMSRREQSMIQAQQTGFWEWSGYHPGDSLLQTGMTLKRGFIKRLKDTLLATTYVSAFGLDEQYILKILEEQRNNPSKFFGGYASSLYVFAKVARQYNIDDIQFQSVISWGDKMFSHYRDLIEKQFKTKIYDTYGTTEGFMIAAQKDSDYYYINSPNIFLELLDKEGKPVPDGELGHVVVTNLNAYEMPLIRYYLGDLAIKLPRDKYPANRSLKFPMLERIIGRDTDIVVTPSGKSMIVHFFTAIFEHYPSIRQFRVVQKDISGIVIQYIPETSFQLAILDEVRGKIHAKLGEEFNVEFIAVSDIPASPSGKPQIIVSELRR